MIQENKLQNATEMWCVYEDGYDDDDFVAAWGLRERVFQPV